MTVAYNDSTNANSKTKLFLFIIIAQDIDLHV